jgi:beta-mannanase
VWSPLSGRVPASLYPGSRYVDVVGLSAFNGGTALDWGGWQSFGTLFAPGLRSAHVLAPGKPVEISETGSAAAGGSKAAWIAGLFAYLARQPEIRTLVWFDLRKQADWRIESSSAAQRAFAAGAARRR